jgi:hypothetical protein
MVLILAVLLVYAVMASQYESLRDPFIIMFSVPVAGIGVVLSLLLTGTSFSMQAYIGIIMLAGIVVSNAILLVDYINTLRRRDGLPIREAGRTWRTHATQADSDDVDRDDARARADGDWHRRGWRVAGAPRSRRDRRIADVNPRDARPRAGCLYPVRRRMGGDLPEERVALGHWVAR